MERKVLRKNRGKNYVKSTLLEMEIGDEIEIEHPDFYCKGNRSACTIIHYTFELKEQGIGEWTSKHISIGLVNLKRVK